MPGLVLDVDVVGTPAPQGSKRHVGNGRMVEMSKRVKPWREAVKTAALIAMATALTGNPPTTGELAVDVSFWLARPKSHFRTGKNAHLLREAALRARPATRPDIDKLVRSTLDALKDAGVYRDDSQIVTLAAGKWYADGQPPGARIVVREVA